jgi:hypothetical protein
MSRSINAALDGAKTQTAKLVGETTTLKAAMIKKYISTTDRAKNRRLGATLRLEGTGIPAGAFTVNPPYTTGLTTRNSGGLSIKVWANRSGVMWPHAFWARMPNGFIGVFAQVQPPVLTAGGKYKITGIVGPNIATVFLHTPGLEQEVVQTAVDRMQSTLANQVNFLLGQAG